MSAQTTGTEIDLNAVLGDAAGAAKGIALGPELMNFAESLARRDADALAHSRAALLAAGGPAVLVDAAGVAANFQRMVRIADSIGIPVDDLNAETGRAVRAALRLSEFPGARNSGL
ncbi:MAG: hypothetical protein KF911_11235 [Pseudomonadales bacterium]|nr:hypothetical protein [Pseudomonadales bacterium]